MNGKDPKLLDTLSTSLFIYPMKLFWKHLIMLEQEWYTTEPNTCNG